MKPDETKRREPVEFVTDRYPSNFFMGEIFVSLVSILWDALYIVKAATIRFVKPRR
jgi:hypothetical protein